MQWTVGILRGFKKVFFLIRFFLPSIRVYARPSAVLRERKTFSASTESDCCFAVAIWKMFIANWRIRK
jgi:hypothetical protein